MSTIDKEITNILISDLEKINKKLTREEPYNEQKYKNESRLQVTKLFLHWYFSLLAGSFIFCAAYNIICAHFNAKIPVTSAATPLKYLEVSSIVSLLAATLSSGFGFVIGYYFKNKDES